MKEICEIREIPRVRQGFICEYNNTGLGPQAVQFVRHIQDGAVIVLIGLQHYLILKKNKYIK